MSTRTPLSPFRCLRISVALICGVCLWHPVQVRADDWPGWLGPKRDGVYRESGLIERIPESGLKVKWRHPISVGYAGPAEADGKVFVFDYVAESGKVVNDPNTRAQLNGKERLVVLDADSGEMLWQHAWPRPYEISYPSGPRATPTVDGQRVYVLGAQGDLLCLNVEDGAVVWQRNLVDDFDAEVPIWGFSAHPLVDGDLLYTMVGGSGQGVVAFDKATGKVRWKALDVKAGYCAPRVIEHGGVRQLIVFHPEGVQSLDPVTGKSYWDVPMQPSYEMSIAQPMIDGDRMYASSIHTEAVMIQLGDESPTAKELWRGEAKNAVHCSNAPPKFVDGVVYGTDCLQGNLIAVDGGNGDRLWETFAATKPDETRFIKHGTAFITRIGDSDRFFLMSENGDFIMARLSEEGYEELGRMHAVEPTNEAFGRNVVWSHPAYANRTAYIRNDREIIAIDLAK